MEHKKQHSLQVQRLRAAVASQANRPKTFKNRRAYDRNAAKRELKKEA